MPKTTILDNVIRKLARERADRLRNGYLGNGVSAEELASAEAELKAELAPMFKTWKPSMRMPVKGISGAISDNRFKNLFETQTSYGYNDPSSRREISNEYFGDMPDEEREKYGYIRRPKKYGYDEVENYGDYIVEFKPSVRRRMTVTNGDSFNNFEEVRIFGSTPAPGTPIVIDDPETYINWMGRSNSEFDADPEIYNSRMMRKVIDDLRSNHRPTLGNDRYVEAQYHGPLTLDDVKSVTVPNTYFEPETFRDRDGGVARASVRYGFPVYNVKGKCVYNCR